MDVPTTMNLGAWAMLVFGCAVLYGGLGVCLWIALRHRHPSSRESETRSEVG